MGVELPLCVVVTILECCVTFSGVKLSIRSFVLFIYENTPLTYPKTLIVDDGKEFYGDTTKLMEILVSIAHKELWKDSIGH